MLNGSRGQKTNVFVNHLFYCHTGSSKDTVGLASWGDSYVTSPTDYRRMSALCVQT